MEAQEGVRGEVLVFRQITQPACFLLLSEKFWSSFFQLTCQAVIMFC